MHQPELYSKYNSMQTTDNVYVIENFLSFIKWKNGNDGSQTALDIGCGEGYATSELLLPKLPKSLTKLVGCDISDKMVKFAKNSFRNSRLDFCQLDVMDGDTCKKFRDEFDHVFSFYCLHWIPDHRKAFENMYELLKPGGDMLLSFLGTTPIFEVYENISKNIQWAPYFRKEMVSPYHNCKNPEDVVERILTKTGFENCKCIVEDRRYVFGSWKQLKKSVIAVNPTLPHLSTSERVQYIQDFAKEVRKIYRDSVKLCENNNEEKIPVDYKLIIVYATKPKNKPHM